MSVTVKHPFVSAVADSADTSLVRPSNWNADHTIIGLGTAAELNAGVANGVATLDAGGKVPVSELPAAVLGALSYQGTWNASTNTPTLASGVGVKGYYYVVSVAGSTNLDGVTDWVVGDWAVFNGTAWQKVDNTDAVTSVNGQTGTVVLTAADVGAQPAGTYVTSVAATSPVTSTGGTTPTIAMPAANSTTNGYLTSTDWNTFNSISTGGVVGPASATDNAIARFDTTTGKLIQNSVVTVSDTGAIDGATTITNIDYIDFDTTYATTLGVGQLGWNGNDTLGLGMTGGHVIQHIGEDQFFYTKATATITKGQVVMFTGAVGASGVPTGAPATGITDGNYIMGIAAENIANNGFGLIQSFGTLRNVNTSGYIDGDILWYNPAVTGGLTKTKPVAPNVKAQMAAVINGGSVGGGTILIRISAGSTLGGTDSNAQIDTPTNGQIITYDGLDGYWKNTALTAGTAISVNASSTGVLTVANTAPDQTVSLTAGTGISTTGTYPNFTITNTAPSSGGTVTSVTGTAPVVSSGGNTPAISMAAATTSVNGYLTSTDWNTFNNKTSNLGTVTSVGGTGTVNGITLTGTVTTSGNLTLGGTLSGVSLTTQVSGTLPVANGGTGTATAFTAGSVVFAGASGVYSQDNASLFFDNTNDRLGIGTASPAQKLTIANGAVKVSKGYSYLWDDSNLEIRAEDSPAWLAVANTMTFKSYSGAFVFQNSNGAASIMTVRADNTNVGIGTTTPQAKLSVSNGGAAGFEFFANYPGGGVGTYIQSYNRSSPGYVSTAYDAADHSFRISGTEKMFLNSSGNLGVGTGSPNQRLQVTGSNSTGFAGATLQNSNANVGLAGVQFSSDTTYSKSAIAQVRENANGNGPLVFYVDSATDAADWAAGDEKMRISAAGNMLLGTTSGVDFKLRVNRSGNLGLCTLVNSDTSGLSYDQFQIIVGQSASSAYMLARWYVAAGASPQFAFRGDGQMFATSTSIASISDARVKENVRDADDGLQTILGLRTVRFDFKKGFGNDRKNQLGFIAQEVETVFPDAVDVAGVTTEDGDAHKSVAPGTLIPVLVKAIQEQQALITQLQSDVATLKGN